MTWQLFKRLKRKLKHKRKPKHSVIQTHHISYTPEVTVRLYVGEHWVITQLLRRKRISKGFITALKQWLTLNESKAVEV